MSIDLWKKRVGNSVKDVEDWDRAVGKGLCHSKVVSEDGWYYGDRE